MSVVSEPSYLDVLVLRLVDLLLNCHIPAASAPLPQKTASKGDNFQQCYTSLIVMQLPISKHHISTDQKQF